MQHSEEVKESLLGEQARLEVARAEAGRTEAEMGRKGEHYRKLLVESSEELAHVAGDIQVMKQGKGLNYSSYSKEEHSGDKSEEMFMLLSDTLFSISRLLYR